jgi:hypothetical protein
MLTFVCSAVALFSCVYRSSSAALCMRWPTDGFTANLCTAVLETAAIAYIA